MEKNSKILKQTSEASACLSSESSSFDKNIQTLRRLSASSSTISVGSTQVETRPTTPKISANAEWMLASSASNSVSSASRRICRICQMEGGTMVRPCDCAGTMGDVHEECLTKWVNISQKKTCEICKSEYSKSGAVFKPIRAWNKPKINFKVLSRIIILLCICYLIFYIFQVINERYFVERIGTENMIWRPDDTGRIVLITILGIALVDNLFVIICNLIKYLRSQRQIRFINKH